jgi:uncharacterized protein YecE (DUF72 family)
MESGTIRIGTCSWAQKSLIESGSFYPDGCASAEGRLRFYAGRFDTVEVDSSYYSIPTLQMTQAWVSRTPPGFLFHLKAFGALTGHAIDPGALTGDLRGLFSPVELAQESLQVSDPVQLRALAQALVAALAPLKAARKLGFVLFQFPPWFSCKNANRDYLLYCRELMAGLPIAVEFRHGSWLTRRHAEETFAFLREHKITYVTCDEPQYGNLSTAPFHPELTTCMAYLRLHGRNAETWRQRACSSDDYLYGEQEMNSLSLTARRLSWRARTTFVMFNNCHGGNAVRNALQMQVMLLSREKGAPAAQQQPAPVPRQS